MKRSVWKIFFGALLPIPLVVVSFTLICDVFHTNKEGDYIRLANSSLAHIGADFAFSLIFGTMTLGIPCLIYSGLLEWLRRNDMSLLPVGLGFGVCLGLCIGYLVLPPLDVCNSNDFAEALFHCMSVIFIMGVLIPLMLGDLGKGNLSREQSLEPNS